MKLIPFILIILSGLLTPLTSLGAERVVEDFSTGVVGRFPRGFRTFPFQRDKAEKVYRVAEEGGNLFMAAEDREELSIQIFRKFYWEVQKEPILRWRWRARILPKGSDERDLQKGNDSACGIYVPFGGYTGKVIKYLWSAKLPVGTEILKKPGRSFSVVKSSGEGKEWQEVSVNVVEDYQRLFGERPRQNPLGIGFLTDGNATHSPAACDYDDFAVASRMLTKAHLLRWLRRHSLRRTAQVRLSRPPQPASYLGPFSTSFHTPFVNKLLIEIDAEA